MSRAATLAGLLISLLQFHAAPSLGQEQPLPSDLTEEVEVRFVIIDALVVDPSGRIVTDLTREDFALFLDLVPHPVIAVDVDCPAGALDEPRAVEPGQLREPPPPPEIPRHIALVVDYRNMDQTLRVEVVERLQEMLRSNHVPGEGLMLVAVTRRLRVEVPFTDDRDEILNGLERMKHDASLWQESPTHYLHGGERYHEFELFDALLDVIDLMSDLEGQKAIVLYSDLPTKIEDAEFGRFLARTPAAFDYDRQFEAVSVAATEARIPIYPIHSSGLTRRSPSERLARLAVETGGRFTRNTNDLSLAYVRARRDIGCRYAIGFYDTPEHAGRIRRVNLKARRPGLRVYHPVHYRFGVEESGGRSRSEIAYTAPAPFRDEDVAGQLFVVRPATAKRWQAMLALSFPARVPALESRVVSFGAKLDDGARRSVLAFDREMTVLGDDRERERRILFIEPVTLSPGRYELSVVVDDPDAGGPLTALTGVDVPPLPSEGLVVGQPMLLAGPGDGVTVSWSAGLPPLAGGGGETELAPVLEAAPVSDASLIAVVHLCWAGKESESVRVDVERSVFAAGDGASRRLLPIGIDLQSGGPEHCQRLAGAVPIDALAPGDYELRFRFRVEGAATSVERRAPFTIGEERGRAPNQGFGDTLHRESRLSGPGFRGRSRRPNLSSSSRTKRSLPVGRPVDVLPLKSSAVCSSRPVLSQACQSPIGPGKGRCGSSNPSGCMSGCNPACALALDQR